ncbi:MAG TPA: DUF2382 domain-containing protein [Verrucomicrobiae bacterium]|nr:DUF2382 domain-containing protein [Verrucomicrobiae bacterium]
MQSENKLNNIDWFSIPKKEVIGTEGLDLGKVCGVRDDVITIQRGLITKKKYNIPISYAESFDGDTLKLKVNDTELQRFEYKIENKLDYYTGINIPKFPKANELKNALKEDEDIPQKILRDKTNITKVPMSETKKIDIELKKEIVSIERKIINRNEIINTNENSSDYMHLLEKPIEFRTEISIPITIEEPVIIKRSYVKEEIIVRNKPIIESPKEIDSHIP